jgi:hypothetical protein
MLHRLASSLKFLALFGLLWTVAPVAAHEGHDHGAPPPPVSTTIAPRADASSNDFELVAIARGDQMRLYIDRFRTNEPVNGATVEVDTPAGTLKAAPDGDGVYVVAAPFLTQPGAHDLAITIQSDALVDVLTATITIPEPPAPPIAQPNLLSLIVSSAVAQDLRQRAQAYDIAVWGAAGLGFLAGIVVMLFARRKKAKVVPAGTAAITLGAATAAVFWLWMASPVNATPVALTSPAAPVLRDVAQRFPDGAIFVPKPTQRILAIRTLFTTVENHPGTVELPGRVIPDPNGSGLVQASVAGRLTPPPGGFPRLGTRVNAGDILAFVQPAIAAADQTTQQQQARELDQQISILVRRLERFRSIASSIPRSQIEDAELELAGLRERRANLDRAPRQSERLVAPVTGVIAAVQATAGQIAEPNAIIFQIIDPSRFWIEALSFEAQAIEGNAEGRLPDGRTLQLAYRGSGLADRLQAIPIQFSVEGETRGLRAGQLLTVLATTQAERQGMAVPRTSVLRGPNGQPIVYEHTNAERFVPREVRVEPLDGARVLIISGVEPGRRVVTQGAELLNQIR